MDSKDSIIKEIKTFLPMVTEEFIISISNKGIYKRSLKDLEKVRDSISLTVVAEGVIGVKVDDCDVELNINIQNSTCSCPSTTMCKHRIMGLLYLKEYYENNFEAKSEDSVESEVENVENNEEYKELKELTSEKLLEMLGKKQYNSLINSISIRDEADLQYGDMLTVILPTQNIKVYFPKERSIENSICSCKEKKFCEHRAYALVSYMMREGKISEKDLESVTIKIGEREREFFKIVQNCLESILDRGISGLIGSEIDRLEKFYIQAYGMKFFAVAAELKSLATEIGYYMNKNISFSHKRMLHTICTLYNRLNSLQVAEKREIKNILIGEKQEDKFNLSKITIFGLGASAFLTKRGEDLITSYFYCEDIKKIISMSTLRPNGDIDQLYRMGVIWSDELSFEKVSTSKFVLKDAKLSLEKLSSSKNTVSYIKGATSLEDLKNIVIDDYSIIQSKIRQNKFDYFSPYSSISGINLVKVNKIEELEYDKIEQKLKMRAFDSEGRVINFYLEYNRVTEDGIKYLEKNRGKGIEYILGSISERKGELHGRFLSCIMNDSINNIMFKGGRR